MSPSIEEGSSIQSAISPLLPQTPVLCPVDEPWEASSLILDSPSLVFDSTASFSQILNSPQHPGTLDSTSSPGVFDISHNNPNSPLMSPIMAISTLMFASRRARLPNAGDMLVENLDLPALMRLEIATTLATRRQNQQDTSMSPVVIGDGALLAGLGLAIAPSQLPESSFPSCNSLPSIYSLPSWDPISIPTTSTPPAQARTSSTKLVDDLEQLGNKQVIDLCSTDTHTALSDVPEEASYTLSHTNGESTRQVIGLGLGALAESTLQSSASITRLRSPELPPIAGTLVDIGVTVSMSVQDMERYHNSGM